MLFGDPNLPLRFWAKVAIDPETQCWIWTGSLSKGYGKFGVAGKSPQSAHRLTYTILVGFIPINLQIDHLCRNRACCNPAHLEPVTCRENLFRSPLTQTTIKANQTHCKNGHELTGNNLIIRTRKAGGRDCKKCNTNRKVEAYKKKISLLETS